MIENDSIGARLIRARAMRGWNQAELARKVDLLPGQLYRYEADKTKPRAETLYKLATALDVAPEWLETGRGAMNELEVLDENLHAVRFDLPDEVLVRLHAVARKAGISFQMLISRMILMAAESPEFGGDKPIPSKLENNREFKAVLDALKEEIRKDVKEDVLKELRNEGE